MRRGNETPSPARAKAIALALICCVPLMAAGCQQGGSPRAVSSPGDICADRRASVITAHDALKDRFDIDVTDDGTPASFSERFGNVGFGRKKRSLLRETTDRAYGRDNLLRRYVRAKRARAATAAAVLSAIDTDIQGSRVQVSQIGQAVKGLQRCRKREMAALKLRIEQRQITGAAARAEIAALRARIANDRRLVLEIIGDVDKSSDIFADAVAETQGIDRALVLSDQVQSYKPVIEAPPASGGTAQTTEVPEPQIDAAAKPKTSSEIEELYVQKAELKAGYDVYDQTAVDLLDSAEALIAD